MGMPGMTTEAAAAYAAAYAAAGNKKVSKMTVAEFRNKVNLITHYYDNYDVDTFLADDTISLKQKIEVLFGKMIVNLIDESKFEEILKEMN